MKSAIREVLPEAIWQRCYVHFLRNAFDHLPRKADDFLRELRSLYDRRDVEETLAYYRLPAQHHKYLNSTNMLERLNEEIKRRTHVVRIFPNATSCLRLVRALAVETHETWIEATRYLNMDVLREQKKALKAKAA